MGQLSESITGNVTNNTQGNSIEDQRPPSNLSQQILSPDPSSDLALSAMQSSTKNPQNAARTINLRNKTGLPEDLIERNLDMVEQQAVMEDFDTDTFARTSPKVAKWASESPNNISAGYQDLTNLSYIERQLGNIRDKFIQGQRTVELAGIGESAFLNKASSEQRSRQAEIESELEGFSDYGITGYFEEYPGSIANQIPILANTLKGKAKGAVVGGAGGAAIGAGAALVGGQLGPQAALPEEVVTVPGAAIAVGRSGALAGWRYGAAVEAARMEASLAYLDYEKLTDENGAPLDREIAVGAALMAGTINGTLEFFGFETIAKTVPGLRGLQRKGVRLSIKNPSIQSFIATYAKNIGQSTVTEGVTEFFQEMVTQSGGEIAQIIQDGRQISVDEFLGRIFSDQNLSNALSAARAGSQGGGGITAITGGASTAIDIRKLRNAQEQAEQIRRVGDVIESVDLRKVSPDVVEGLVSDITDGSDVYVPSESFQTYWQEQGQDPREIAREVLGNTEAYDEAIESGTDISIPASKYYTSDQLGAGDHKEFFSNEVRTDPIELNAREWQEEIELLDQEAEQQAQIEADEAVIQEPEVSVRENIRSQLQETGLDSRTADTYAQLYDSTFGSISERSGLPVEELFERFGPEINRVAPEETEGFLNRVGVRVRNLFQNNEDQPIEVDRAPRGAFRRGGDTFSIDLLQDANRSTFLHETGHLYLEVLGDLAQELDDGNQIKSDYQTILDWFGVESRDQVQTDQHEQFARGFEAYVLEGKAPSSDLRKIFARFKVWLTQVYRSIQGLDVNLNDDVRGVFDRLVATENQLAEVDGELNIEPLFEDTSILGSQENKYLETVEEFRLQVSEKTAAAALKEFEREQAKWYREELNETKDQVRASLNENRDYSLLFALQKRTRPDGTPIADGIEVMKLDRKAVRDYYNARNESDKLSQLPRGVSSPDGLAPELVAETFGYANVEQMMGALEGIEKPNDFVDRTARELIEERYPNLHEESQRFKEEATKQIHNEKRNDVLRFELKWLAEEAPTVLKDAIRRVSRRVPSNKDIRQYAKSRIGKMPVNKIRPSVFLRAERNAARDAGQALARGDLDTAFEKKRIELLNHELYKEAISSKEGVEKSVQQFRRIAQSDKKLSKSRDIDLVNAARAVLANHGIGDTEATPESFLENLRQYDPETYEGVIPLVQAISTSPRHYTQLSYDDFVELSNGIEALWDLSRSSKTMEIDGKKVERDQVIQDLSERISEISTPKEKPGYTKQVSKWQEVKMELLGVRAALRRVESWVDAMDGGKSEGAFRRFIWNPISEGADAYRLQKKEYVQRYLDIIKGIENRLTEQEILAPEINYAFSGKSELLGAMLHTGNTSNLEKLLRGRNWGDFNEEGVLETSRWDEFVQRMIDEEVLTKAEYDYLQGVWDLLEELKPQAQRAHKSMYGYFFSEITANEIETPFGMYKGGYVPAAVDPLVSNDQEIRQEKEQLEQFNNSYMFPTTGRGFTKSRVQRYAAPLQMNLRFIPGHIDKALRFINIEPRVKDVGKVIMNKQFQSTLYDFDSGVFADLLSPWLKRSAQQKIETPSTSKGGRFADRFFRGIRGRTGLNIMFGNVVNTMQQFTGLSIALTKVQPRYMRNALWTYVRSPKQTTEDVNNKSAFMNTRVTTNVIEIQNNIEDLITNQGKYEKARDFAVRHGYFLQAGAQNVVDIITWSGKYNEAVEKGADETDAVRQADSAVRQTQGSFNPEDISKFETGSAFVRAFTMFYSYFNMQANLLGTEFLNVSREMGLKKGAGRLLYVYTFGFMVPAVVSELIVQSLSGEFDEDDDDQYLDDFMSYFFGGQFRTATAMFPFVGPSVQAGINAFNDKWYDDRISTSPAVSMLESAVRSPKSVYDAIFEDGNRKRAVRDLLSAIGLITGIPVTAASRPVGYLIDVDEGNARPSGPVDFTRGLITGRPGN